MPSDTPTSRSAGAETRKCELCGGTGREDYEVDGPGSVVAQVPCSRGCPEPTAGATRRCPTCTAWDGQHYAWCPDDTPAPASSGATEGEWRDGAEEAVEEIRYMLSSERVRDAIGAVNMMALNRLLAGRAESRRRLTELEAERDGWKVEAHRQRRERHQAEVRTAELTRMEQGYIAKLATAESALTASRLQFDAVQREVEKLRELATTALTQWYDTPESVGCAEAMAELWRALPASRSFNGGKAE